MGSALPEERSYIDQLGSAFSIEDSKESVTDDVNASGCVAEPMHRERRWISETVPQYSQTTVSSVGLAFAVAPQFEHRSAIIFGTAATAMAAAYVETAIGRERKLADGGN